MQKTVLDIDKCAHILKLLGDKTRLTMIGLLDNNECCVCEFVEIFQLSQPAVSQHMRKLKDAGLVKERRNGQWVFYALNKEHEVYPLIKAVLNHLPDQKDKLEALQAKGRRIICE